MQSMFAVSKEYVTSLYVKRKLQKSIEAGISSSKMLFM